MEPPLRGFRHVGFFISAAVQFTEVSIAKNRNTYAKRQREQDKKFRAERKRQRRDQIRKPDQPETVTGEVAAPEQGNDSER